MSIRGREALAAARKTGDAEKIRQAQAAYDAARVTFRQKYLQIRDANIRPGKIESILSNYRTPAEVASMKAAERKQMHEQFVKDLAALKAAHKDRAALIDRVVAAYKAWAQVRHRLSDPSDLQRRIARAGVLEFRIAAGYRGVQIDRKDKEFYVNLLEKEGPEEVRRRGLPFAWFPIRNNDRKELGGLILAQYAGRWYALLCNQEGYKMVRERAVGGWRLTDAFRDADSMGRPAIGFKFDEAGAKLFYSLTSSHVGKAMAILLDDEVFSAPNIQSAISDRGQITGRFTPEEVEDFVRLLEAGSLPARLNPNPVAVRSFGPTLGQENRKKGITAAYMGMICVAAFMLLYYRLPGLIADVALVLNIVFVLGTMSLLGAVFTLPGIAGVVLTIGIAVDANVLIFERLREEQTKGQSVRMALKNAYERAFSAIFDANVTTLITCVILAWVGTIEVRGFAITLGLGVLFSMFTALVVTRWIFQLMLDKGLLKRPLGMMKIIGVPVIGWMAKRRIFWGLSMTFIVLGVASVIWQGGNIWGIEFSSGTQAMIQFRDDALIGPKKQLPNDEIVRTLFTAEAAREGRETLRDARVEMLLDPQKVDNFLRKYDGNGDGKVTAAEAKAARLAEAFFKKLDTAPADGILTRQELQRNLPPSRYQVSTTETNLELIQQVADKAFGNALARRVECSFKPAAEEDVRVLALTTDAEGKARIEASSDSPFRDLLEEYQGGVAVVVKDVQPPITAAELSQRIHEMRAEEGTAGTEMRQTEVLPLGRPAEGNAYNSFAVLVKLDEVVPGRWRTAAESELQLVGDALKRKQSMVAMSFDPAIAGLAAQRAIIAIVLSWIAIVLYLWLRFGSVQWGLAAVICLIHDVTIAVGLVAASGWLYKTAVGQALGMDWFKIDLAMIAALLTVIGYSVNDTIVIFDRIRENRGKLTAISPAVIDRSINQTLARTLLTSGTTFIVVFIMYVWGGQGIKGFNFALLVGVVFGTYSSVAIASPLLMGFRKALVARTTGSAAESA
ncbi:MAG: protein translocase subunit SecD, partial [Planctomycetes bacterium]|nr:protein translocase subunit SecD [Planctomycetota bacterium]